MKLPDLLSVVEVFVAFVSFVVIGLMLHEMNDKISDRTSHLSLRRLIAKAARRRRRITLFDMGKSEARIDIELEMSEYIASFAIILTLLPVILLFTGEESILAFNVIVYLICAILIVVSYLLNRLANRAQKHLERNLSP